MRVTVLTPAYNEEDVITGSCKAILAAIGDDDELLVVDDGSVDRTAELLSDAAREDTRLRIVSHESNQGLGAALATGFAAASGDVIVTMDADLSQPIDLLPRLVAVCVDADAAFASRYVRGGGMAGVPWWRQWISRVANGVVRVAFRFPVRDMTTGYRAVRADVVRDLPLVSTGFEVQLELTARLVAAGRRIVEVPFVLQQRAAGMSKMRYLRIVPRYVRTLRLVVRLRRKGV